MTRSFPVLACLLFLFSEMPGAPEMKLQPVVSGLTQPVFLTSASDQSGRLFIVEQTGRLRILENNALHAQPFLDLSGRVTSGGERGLLGLAFHPDFSENDRFFVNYTSVQEGQLRTVISEFKVTGPDADIADPSTERILLQFDQPYSNHNGGMLAFGADGLLYISTGDGGSGGDPQGNAQKLDTFLGKILRIDVDEGDPYSVPNDNPFVGVPGARSEIWAFGLRNPWRFSFDRPTGRLFAADVGQNRLEEVNLIVRGGNYGWNTMEGGLCFSPEEGCPRGSLILPIAEYARDEGRSITGGYVYRGRQNRELVGTYIFGDFASGRIWLLRDSGEGTWSRELLLESGRSISSFGTDDWDELYLVDYGGEILKLVFPLQIRFAHAGDGTVGSYRFQSRVTLVNNEERAVIGVLRFVDDAGITRPLTVNGQTAEEFPFEIGPRSTQLFETNGSSQPFYAGWANVAADGPIGGVLIYSLQNPSGAILGEAGVADSAEAKKLAGPVSRDTGAGIDTGLAVANPSSTDPAAVIVRVKDGAGDELLVADLSLKPGEHRAFFISEIGELPEVFEGTVLLDAEVEIIATLIRTVDGVQSASLPLIH